MSDDLQSWGRTRPAKRRATRSLRPLYDGVRAASLPFGNGRSYGDSCHNDDGLLLDRRGDAGIISFDTQTGVVRVRAGTLLGDLARSVEPHGWFPAVVPGTRFVTVGGAFANDVHGKNHHLRSSFAQHVLGGELERSDGTVSLEPGTPLFEASAGGMGLTGVVRWLDIQLMKVAGGSILQEARAFSCIEDFLERQTCGDGDPEYSVAWVDSCARGASLGRGVLLTGEHVPGEAGFDRQPRLTVPFQPPFSVLGRPCVRHFNAAYRWSQLRRPRRTVPAAQYFWPLDGVSHWNRLYGPRGLHQHQSVVPLGSASALRELLEAAHDFGQASFLTVLKRFGDMPSAGPLSFPMPGYTLTLDFPHRGHTTLELLDRLDAITLAAGGRTNAYKDGRMSARTFQRGYPRWGEVEAMRDPALISDFWRRCTARRIVRPPSLVPDLEPAKECAA